MPVALPELLLPLQMGHLSGGEGGEHAAVLQVAADAVAGDEFAQDASALEGHLADPAGLFGGEAAFDHVDVAAVAVDDLPAVAA